MSTVGIDTIVKALDVSLDRRKAGFAIGGLLITALVGGVFTYISIEAGSGFISVVSDLVGALSVWILLTLVVGTLAKMSYNELDGHRRSGWGAPLAYSRRHLGTLLFSSLLVSLGIFLLQVAQLVVLFPGRIPYLGELWVAVLFLPLLVLNLVLVILSYMAISLIPAVVAAEGRGVLDTLSRVRQLIQRAPGQILAYLSVALVLSLLAALVVLPLTYSALSTTRKLVETALGESRIEEFRRAIPIMFGSVPDLLSTSLGLPNAGGTIPFTMKLARLLLIISVLSIPVFIFAEFFLVFPVACASATYLRVTKATPTLRATQPEPQMSSSLAFCINCGAELPPGTKFCVQCGASQEAAPARG